MLYLLLRLIPLLALAASENACDTDLAAKLRERAAMGKRGIADMPYSVPKLNEAERKVEALARPAPDKLGEELARLHALSQPAHDGVYRGPKAHASLAVLADAFDPPRPAQRAAVEKLLPKVDELYVVVDRRGSASFADRVAMAKLALGGDQKIKFVDKEGSPQSILDGIASQNPWHTVTAVTSGDAVLSKEFRFARSPNARYAFYTTADDSDMIMGVAKAKAGGRKSMVSNVVTPRAGDLDPEVARYLSEHPKTIHIAPDEVGLIGYGSLLNRDSIERTLGRELPAEAVHDVEVEGWSRAWNVWMPNERFYEEKPDGTRDYPAKIAYLNFKPNPGCRANCSLFIIKKSDLDGFDKREWIYEREDFSGKLFGARIEGGQAFAYLGKKEYLFDPEHPGDVRMRASYSQIVEDALKEKGAAFQEEYRATTEAARPPAILDREDPGRRPMNVPVEAPKPPRGVPYIALGFFNKYEGDVHSDRMKEFSLAMEKREGHAVVSWHTFGEAGYSKLWSWNKLLRRGPVGDVDDALKIAVERAQGKKVVLFNLDDFDVERAFTEAKPGVTAQEARLILSNPAYFNATRWFKGGQELSDDEIRALFGPYFPEAFR